MVDETVTCSKDMFPSRKSNVSMFTIDSTTIHSLGSTLGMDTNDMENDTGAYTTLYSGQVEEAL